MSLPYLRDTKENLKMIETKNYVKSKKTKFNPRVCFVRRLDGDFIEIWYNGFLLDII